MNRSCEKCERDKKCTNCAQISRIEKQQEQKKTAWVQSLLSHPVDEFIHSPKWLNYRARISVRPNRDGILGYYQPKSHEHVPLTNCSLAHQQINQLLENLPALSFAANTVEFRSDYRKIVVSISAKKKLVRQQIIDWAQGNHVDLVLNGKPIQGDGRLTIHCGGVTHRIRPNTFFQVNLEVNAKLISTLMETINHLQPTHILDLFAGAGNLSLPLVKNGFAATLIESASSSCADARDTVKRESLQAKIIQKNAYQYTAGQTFFDVVLLDPPRKGTLHVLPQILMTMPKAIIYVSCNPFALAKDIKPAIQAGYKIQKLMVFDMFPQTDHVEVFCLLSKQ